MGSGGPPRGRSAHRRVPYCGGRDAQPAGLGKTPPARGQSCTSFLPRPASAPLPGSGMGLGGRPRVGGPAGRYISGDRWRDAWFSGLGQDSSGLWPLGPPASFTITQPHILRSRLGLGYDSPLQELGDVRTSELRGAPAPLPRSPRSPRPSPALQPAGHALGAGTPRMATADAV